MDINFNTSKNNRKPTYTWKLNNTLLNDNLVMEKKELKTFENVRKMRHKIPKLMGHNENSAKRKTQL